MATIDAVEAGLVTAEQLLNAQGYRVRKMAEGVTDWVAAGLPIETETPR